MTYTHNKNQVSFYSLNESIIDYSINITNLDNNEFLVLEKIRNYIFGNRQISNGNCSSKPQKLIEDISDFFLIKFPGLFCQECMEFTKSCLRDFIHQKLVFQYFFPAYEISYLYHHNRILNYKLIHQLNRIFSNEPFQLDTSITNYSMKSYHKFILLLKRILTNDTKFLAFTSNSLLSLQDGLISQYYTYIENHKSFSERLFKTPDKHIIISDKKSFHRFFPLFYQHLYLKECKEEINDIITFNEYKLKGSSIKEMKSFIKKFPLYHDRVIIRLKSLKGFSLALIAIYDYQIFDEILRKNQHFDIYDHYIIDCSKNKYREYKDKLHQYFKISL